MATFKKIIRNNGQNIVYIQYCHKNKVALFSTGIQVDPENWNASLEWVEGNGDQNNGIAEKYFQVFDIVDELKENNVEPTVFLVKAKWKALGGNDRVASLRVQEKNLVEHLKSIRLQIKTARIREYIIKYRKIYLSSKGYARKVIEKRLGYRLDIPQDQLDMLLENKKLQLKILRILKNGESNSKKPHRPVQPAGEHVQTAGG
jgi:hypothetical protein